MEDGETRRNGALELGTRDFAPWYQKQTKLCRTTASVWTWPKILGPGWLDLHASAFSIMLPACLHVCACAGA